MAEHKYLLSNAQIFTKDLLASRRPRAVGSLENFPGHFAELFLGMRLLGMALDSWRRLVVIYFTAPLATRPENRDHYYLPAY